MRTHFRIAVLLALTALCVPAAAEADRSAYVANSNSDDVSAYDVAANGDLVQLAGSPYAAGTDPRAAVTTPDAENLYVSNYNGTSFSGYAIASTGALSPLAGSPFPANDSPDVAAVTPDGAYLYVTNLRQGSVSGFAVAPDGSLTQLAGSPFALGAQPDALAVTPDGEHLYVDDSAGLATFTIAADGSLSEVGSPVPADLGGNLAVAPDGGHLYGTNTFDDSVSVYDLAANGTPTEIPGSPVPAGTSPFGIDITPDGTHLYAVNYNSNDVSGYAVAADGSLTELAGSPTPTGGSISAELAISPDGEHLYATSELSANVTGYDIAADGDLTELAASPYAAGANPGQITISPNQPPLASIAAHKAGRTGLPVTFDASGSSDSDGGIVRYDWSFGDGTTLPDGGPTVTHTFNPTGPYDVSVTLTDDEGCSLTLVYTGHVASCNGQPSARAIRRVHIKGPKTTITAKPRYAQRKDTRLRFHSSIPGSKFRCKLDRSKYQPCKSPRNYKRLDPGKHKFSVFAIAPSGVADDTPAKAKFVVKGPAK